MEKQKQNNNRDVIRYAGAYIAAIIGAGFASGQELLQFFTSHGIYSIFGLIIAGILFICYGASFMILGHKLKAKSHEPVLKYLCGNHVGRVFEWVTTFFLFGVLTIMIAGGGAALTQHLGISQMVGRVIMTAACIITVIMGLDAMVSAIGIVAPLAVVLSIIVGLTNFFQNYLNLAGVSQVIQELNLPKAAPNWFFSSILYISYAVMSAIPMLAAMGAQQEDDSVLYKSSLIGGLGLGICGMVLNLGMLTTFRDLADKEVPVLFLATRLSTFYGWIFVVVLLGAIYSTAVPMLYGFVARFSEPGTRKYRLMTIITGIVALIASMFPFGELVGTIYPLFGYLGLVVMAAVVNKLIIKKDVFVRSKNMNR